MVKHIIIWNFKDDVANKPEQAQIIKTALENLVGQIDGLLEMRILTDGFPSSSGDLMMDSTFESNAALQNYQKAPIHQEIAKGLVAPVMQSRASFDYEV